MLGCVMFCLRYSLVGSIPVPGMAKRPAVGCRARSLPPSTPGFARRSSNSCSLGASVKRSGAIPTCEAPSATHARAALRLTWPMRPVATIEGQRSLSLRVPERRNERMRVVPSPQSGRRMCAAAIRRRVARRILGEARPDLEAEEWAQRRRLRPAQCRPRRLRPRPRLEERPHGAREATLTARLGAVQVAQRWRRPQSREPRAGGRHCVVSLQRKAAPGSVHHRLQLVPSQPQVARSFAIVEQPLPPALLVRADTIARVDAHASLGSAR
eukprot:2063248-Prymnesium_polylepis.1